MTWLRALFPLVLALVFAGIVSASGGFGSTSALPLIHVTDLTPRELEPGDLVALTGDGFPAGRPARVTFRGTLYRPGELPERHAEVVAWGTAESFHEVDLELTGGALSLFCGGGDRRAHTTFDGDVEVAFAAASAGSPPIAGTLSGVTLDVRPAPPDVGMVREGLRVLEALGLEVKPEDHGAGLRVVQQRSDTPAAKAGVAVGDVITRFDGVRVGSAADVLPAPGEWVATMSVRQKGLGTEVRRSLDVGGLRPAPAAHWSASWTLIMASLAAVVLLSGPTALAPAAFFAHLASRVRSQYGPAFAKPWIGPFAGGGLLARVLGDAVRGSIPALGPLAVLDALALAAITVLPFGQYVIAANVDGCVLFLSAATGLSLASLLARDRVIRRLVAALHVMAQHVPAAIAIVSIVVATGSLRIQEIARAEGAWPRDWLAFRSPGTLMAFFAFASVLRVHPAATRKPAGVLAWLDPRCAPPEPSSRPWEIAVMRAHAIVMAGLAVVLFLGGWSLPWLSPAQTDARPLLQAAGAAALLLKVAFVLALRSVAQSMLPSAPPAERTRRALLFEVPLALGALAVTTGWLFWGPGPMVEPLVSASMVVLLATAALALAFALHKALWSPRVEDRLSSLL